MSCLSKLSSSMSTLSGQTFVPLINTSIVNVCVGMSEEKKNYI